MLPTYGSSRGEPGWADRITLLEVNNGKADREGAGDTREAVASQDFQQPAAERTVEAWARSPKNPVRGWYGLKKGLRGRFANYVPPVMEALGLAEVGHNPKNNRMRAL